jgi:hypothetical protein
LLDPRTALWSFMYHGQSTVLSMADWKAKGHD